MSKIVVLREKGAITVITETKGIRSLVVDRDVGGVLPRVKLEGSLAAVDSILDGIPKVAPERVAAIFEEVSAQRSLPGSVAQNQVTEAEPHRLVVLLKPTVTPTIMVATPAMQVLFVDRDQVFGIEPVQVESAPAAISTLCQVAPERINRIFSELAPQINDIIGAPEFALKDRVQLTYLAQKWLSREAVSA